MEHSILAPFSGKVLKVNTNEGDQVDEGFAVYRNGSKVMTEITIYEVGPRDGLQNESVPLSAKHKISFIDILSQTGLKFIESGAFVSPKWVPAMADSHTVMTDINRSNE